MFDSFTRNAIAEPYVTTTVMYMLHLSDVATQEMSAFFEYQNAVSELLLKDAFSVKQATKTKLAKRLPEVKQAVEQQKMK